MPPDKLKPLALELAGVAAEHKARLIVNSSLEAAEESGAWGIQLPFSLFMSLAGKASLRRFKIGVSIHGINEALAAQEAGADLVLAGNIFETGCKPGLEGKGLNFLESLRDRLAIPVWAVGGILPGNALSVRQSGAAGLCVMSPLMLSQEPELEAAAYINALFN